MRLPNTFTPCIPSPHDADHIKLVTFVAEWFESQNPVPSLLAIMSIMLKINVFLSTELAQYPPRKPRDLYI